MLRQSSESLSKRVVREENAKKRDQHLRYIEERLEEPMHRIASRILVHRHSDLFNPAPVQVSIQQQVRIRSLLGKIPQPQVALERFRAHSLETGCRVPDTLRHEKRYHSGKAPGCVAPYNRHLVAPTLFEVPAS